MKKTVEKSGRGCIASIRMVDIYYNKDGSIDSNSDTNGYCLYTFDYKNNIITGTMVSDTSSEVVEFHKFGRFGKEEFYLNLYGNIIHLKYHFNKQGLLTKETSIDTTASNYKETNYFYDNRKRLIKKSNAQQRQNYSRFKPNTIYFGKRYYTHHEVSYV
ncbi:MAG: hypothetical protein UZ08_BCD001001877 [Candidatus Parvibacillus calidus]|nr:MAG: hypothetical protein UZ08_BCD001001877 [Candidatus Parvibacillus calidus]